MHDDYHKFADIASFKFDVLTHRFHEEDLYVSFGNCIQGRELDLVYDFSFDYIMTMAYLYLSDREGMGNSLEIRSPLLDYQLVEFVSSLPQHYKYVDGLPKYFMKQVVEGLIPEYIINGAKKGFTPPGSFINDVVENYQYKVFNADHKFYNSVLADRLLSVLLKQ
jgi:asparagine synthase (glutamine-hydrolysing)